MEVMGGARFQSAYMIFVNQLISFSGAGPGAVPGLDTEKWRLVRIRGPKGDGFKVRIGNLDSASVSPVNEGDSAGGDFRKIESVVPEECPGQRNGTAAEFISAAVGEVFSLETVKRHGINVFFFLKYKTVILEDSVFLHGTAKARMGSDAVVQGRGVYVGNPVFQKKASGIQFIGQ